MAKILSITSRVDSLHAPLFDKVPPPPRDLNRRAKAIWRRAAKDLHERGMLSRLYVTSLRMYCVVLARCEALPVDVPVKGMTQKKWDRYVALMWRGARAQARAMSQPRPGPRAGT